MSLLRLAFWLALLVLLLPTDAAQQARLISFATAALERLSTFCDRNARACDGAAAAWGVFLTKAEFGVRLVGDLLGANGRPGAQYGPDAPPGPYGRKHTGKVDPRVPPPPHVYHPPWRPPTRP